MRSPILSSSPDTASRSRPSAKTVTPTTLVLPDSARLPDRRKADQAHPSSNISPGTSRTRGKNPQNQSFADEDLQVNDSAVAVADQTEKAETGNPNIDDRPERLLPVRWSPPPGRLILVARARGGIGATSLAVNLALELSKKRISRTSRARKKVSLVDFDIQFGTVATSLDLVDRGGLVKLLQLPRHPDSQAVRSALVVHGSGLRVLAAPASPIPFEALDGPRVAAIIDALMAESDTVIVDMPPALVRWIEPLVVRAERLLIVSNLSVTSVTSARRMLDTLREDAPNLVVETVVSREHKPLVRTSLHRQAAEAIGAPLSYWLPDDAYNARRALDRGEPMLSFAPRSSWSRAVRRIAQSLHNATLRQQPQR